MIKRATALFLLAAAGCEGGETAINAAPDAPATGWAIAAPGDLNTLFDCLEAAGKTIVAAHRGGPASGFPENALETFANTVSAMPALLEIDVATSSDGVTYLMHDDTLDRTTTGSGPGDALAFEEIRALRLKDPDGRETAFHPPTFAEALAWADGRAILEIDFKKTTRYETVIDEINRQQAEDRVILIAYTMAQAERLHRLAPEAMVSLSLSTQSDLNRAIAAGVPADRLLGFTGIEDPRPRLFSILNNQDVEVIFGTLGGRSSIDRQIEAAGDDAFYAQLAGMGVDIIATDRPEAAQRALEAENRAAEPGQCGITKS